jgi:CheY-like chemotaxis protein
VKCKMLANLFRNVILPWPIQKHVAKAAEGAADAIVMHYHPFSILVGEDDRTKQKVIANILESAGHRATIVEDGEAALDALDLQKFDLMLMNVNSPAINGIDSVKLYRFISLGRPRVPIVALAAEATMELGRLCREAGMDGCITEPIDPYSVLKLIEILMLDAEQQPTISPE